MFPAQVIDPQILSQFIALNEDILRIKFPEPKNETKVGRPRIGLQWVLIAICVFAKIHNLVWRELPSQLRLCDFLIDEGLLRAIPSQSTFHRMWMQVSEAMLKSWIRMIGYQEGITSVIPCKNNSTFEAYPEFMGFQGRYQKQYPGIYKKNTQSYKRAEVKHVFGEIKLHHIIIRDNYLYNKYKTLLCSLLWYNHKNRLRRLEVQ